MINTLGNANDLTLCTIDRPPDNLGVKYYCMAEGKRIGNNYPSHASIRMSDEYSGVKLSSFLGNTQSYLIGSQAVKETIESYCSSEVEYLSFTLYSPRGTVHSTDYFIINPIGGFDCLKLSACDIKYLPGKTTIVKIRKFVLDAAKIIDAPSLFRIKEAPAEYVIDDTLAAAFQSKRFTNLVLNELEQVGDK
jgi:hypothetical protein